MPRDSLPHTFKIAFVLCVVCSVMVSAAAVLLRPAQQVNKQREFQRHILRVSGLLEGERASAERIQELSKAVTRKLVALPTKPGVVEEVRYVESPEGDVDPRTFDQRTAARDPKFSIAIPAELDLGGIKRRAMYAYVYLVEKDGVVDQIVLPVSGMGLWSTLYGFVALDADRRTIRGLTFYEHGETPGLGGEVDNEAWKAQWKGKQPFQEDWDIVLQVAKPGRAIGIAQVDGISGATITSRGVENLLRYWLGPHGFGPYLQKLPELEKLRQGPRE